MSEKSDENLKPWILELIKGLQKEVARNSKTRGKRAETLANNRVERMVVEALEKNVGPVENQRKTIRERNVTYYGKKSNKKYSVITAAESAQADELH